MSININLRDYYPWYTHDEFEEISNEIAAELAADKRYEKSYQERVRYNRAYYSLDVEDGIEMSALACHSDNPEHIFAMTEQHCGLCRALNSLPEIQGRRVEAHFLRGLSVTEIARREGVVKSSVSESITKGLAGMKKYFENLQNQPEQSCSESGGI